MAKNNDTEQEWTQDEKRQIQAMADSIAAVRLAQVVAAGFVIWYLCHGDWGGVAVALLCAGFLQMLLPRRRLDLERKAERLTRGK